LTIALLLMAKTITRNS